MKPELKEVGRGKTQGEGEPPRKKRLKKQFVPLQRYCFLRLPRCIMTRLNINPLKTDLNRCVDPLLVSFLGFVCFRVIGVVSVQELYEE